MIYLGPKFFILDNVFYMIQSTYFSPVFWNCLRFKRGPNFQEWGGKPILQNNWIAWIEGAWFLGRNQALLKNSWIIWSPLLYLYFKTFKDPNSSSFIRFPCVLYDSEDFFVSFLKFLQIKEGGPNFWGEQILQKVWIISSPFCISTLKVSWTQFLCHSLDFNAFCMIEEYFSQTLDISRN